MTEPDIPAAGLAVALAGSLVRAGLEATADELADVLWLLDAYPTDVTAGAHPPQRGVDQTSGTPIALADERVPAMGGSAELSQASSGAATRLYRDDADAGMSGAAEPAAREVAWRPTGPLGDPLEFVRALRPFKRVRELGSPVVDLDATVEATAEAGHLVVVLRPRSQRRLDVALVTDTSTSVAVWSDSLTRLERVFAQVGAFRSVSRWELVVAPAPVVPTVREGVMARHVPAPPQPGIEVYPGEEKVVVRDVHGREYDAGRIIDPSGRRLVLLVTDATSQFWYGRRSWAAVERWARVMPTTVLQTLPRHYWPETALGNDLVDARAPWPASPNNQLRTRAPRWVRDEGREGRIPLLVAPLSARGVGRWADALAGGLGWSPALVPAGWTATTAPARANAGVSGEDRVRAFRRRASPGARRLAERLALAPLLSVDLMHVLRASLDPPAGVTELSEVLVSGLLETVAPDVASPAGTAVAPDGAGGGPASSQVTASMAVYRFRPDVGELLRRGATAFEDWQILDVFTDHARQLGLDGDGLVRALVADPRGPTTMGPRARLLAEVMSSLAVRLGLAEPLPLPGPGPGEVALQAWRPEPVIDPAFRKRVLDLGRMPPAGTVPPAEHAIDLLGWVRRAEPGLFVLWGSDETQRSAALTGLVALGMADRWTDLGSGVPERSSLPVNWGLLAEGPVQIDIAHDLLVGSVDRFVANVRRWLGPAGNDDEPLSALLASAAAGLGRPITIVLDHTDWMEESDIGYDRLQRILWDGLTAKAICLIAAGGTGFLGVPASGALEIAPPVGPVVPHPDGMISDFFLSYAPEDEEWAVYLVSLLEQDGYSVHWLPAATRRFRSSVRILDDALRTSRRTILLASAAYFRSEEQQDEWTFAWNRDPLGLSRSLIVVRLEECGLDPLLLLMPKIDLFGNGEAGARSLFLQDIRQVVLGLHQLPALDPVAVTGLDYSGWGNRRQFMVSCDAPDESWARWIVWNLEEAGYSTIFESFDHFVGERTVTWLSAALRRSDRTIFVASRSAVHSVKCEAQWRVRAAMSLSGAPNGVLVVRTEECVLPDDLLLAPRVDLFGRAEAECREQLLEFVRSLGFEPESA